MNRTEQARFERLYNQHLTALKLQGKRPKTVEAYARAVRRIAAHFDQSTIPVGRIASSLRLGCSP